MNIRKFSFMLLALAFSVGYAASPEEDLFVQDEFGHWTFSAGPVWRSRVKISTSGRIVAPPVTPSSYPNHDMRDSANWGEVKRVPNPDAGKGMIPDDAELWGVDHPCVEIYGTAGQDYVVNMSDVERPLGANLQAAYDIYQTETWSIALTLRFTGYWNLRSSSTGNYNAGTKVTKSWTDYYVFNDVDPDGDFYYDKDFNDDPAFGHGSPVTTETDYLGSRTVTTRFRGDLYQIGIGPKIVWSPFANGDETAGWLDLYCSVEFLGNFAHSELSADGNATSETTFLFGVSGALGAAAFFTENCGAFGQVGYEWIDDTEVSVGGFRSKVDYSSMVLSAGFQMCF